MKPTPERLSITLGAARLAFLQAEAARLAVGIGELIRRIVDQYREQRAQTPVTLAQATLSAAAAVRSAPGAAVSARRLKCCPEILSFLSRRIDRSQ